MFVAVTRCSVPICPRSFHPCRCYFVASYSLTRGALAEEREKRTGSPRRGLADNYCLFTTGSSQAMRTRPYAPPSRRCPALGTAAVSVSSKFSQFIREPPRLRMLVPRLYGL